jgi:alkylation response protein AidB-like acyl-CoA dehydrogenase
MDKWMAGMEIGLNGEQEMFRARVRELAQGPIKDRAAEVDRTEEYPWDNVEHLKDAGFLGMTIPEQYGGQGKTWLDAVLLIEEMSQACAVTGRIAVETNMGAVSAIMAYGSEEQKKLAADLVLSGDKPAICITEPGAGSSAGEMLTRADRRGNHYVINGGKHWITGGGVSRLHLIFARVFDEQGEEEGIGGFLAIRDETEGLKIVKREPTMGLRGIPEAEISFEDMEVPPSSLITPPRGFKKGFADLMNAYNSQRVGAATVALGIAEGAYELALNWSEERHQFGRPIYEFQGLQWKLADMSIKLAASQALVYKAAKSGEGGFPDMLMAAQAKIFTSENAIQVVNEALQFFGARGYSRNNPVERMARDVRMFTIGGGTAEVLRTVVAGQLLGKKLPQTRDGFSKLAAES